MKLNFNLPQDVLKIWWMALAVKLFLAAILPMSLDESYYWIWGKNLQLSYFDHPPAVSWLFYLGSLFDNFGQASRWPGVVMGHFTVFIWLLIGKAFLDSTKLKWLLWLLILSPLMGLGSLIITPDIPLMFFWSLATLLLVNTTSESGYKHYLILGSVLGLGFCSKYHIALYLPFALLALFLGQALTIKSLPKVILGFIGFLLFSLPVLFWNYSNDWISFVFQLNHGFSGGDWKPEWTINYILGQLIIIFPTILWLSSKSFFSQIRQNLFLSTMIVFGFGPLLFFLYSSFKAHVEPNWPIIAVPFLLTLAVSNSSAAHWKIKSAMIFGVFISLVALSDSLFRWIPGEPGQIKSQEFYYYDGIIEYLKDQDLQKQQYYGRTFQMASKLSYELKTFIPKLKGSNRFDYFDMHPLSEPRSKKIFLFVRRGEGLPIGTEGLGYTARQRISIDSTFDLLELVKP